MCVAFDESGSILWTGDDRGNMFAALFDMTTGKLHSCKRYILQNSNHLLTILCVLGCFQIVMVLLQVFRFDFVRHVMDVKDFFWLMLFLIYS